MPERISLDGIADPAGEFKDAAERRLARVLGRELTAQEKRILAELGEEAVLDNLDNEFWNTERAILATALLIPMIDFVQESANFAVEASPVGVDIGVLNEQASAWAEQHAGRLITQISDTTRQNVARSVARYLQTPNAEFRDLEKLIGTQFGASRAEMIAVTEVTNAYEAGEQIVQRELLKQDVQVVRVWQTMQDEKVCPICLPLHNTREEYPGGGFRGGLLGPAAHPRCRCWTIKELLIEDGE